MRKKILSAVLAVSGLMLFILPPTAGARIVPECMSGGTSGACGLCDFFLLIANIFDFIASKLAPPVAGFLFIVAGFLFLTSGGSEERVAQAKKIFINVIIGLAAIYASWMIVGSLINVIGKSTEGFNPQSWNQFNCQK